MKKLLIGLGLGAVMSFALLGGVPTARAQGGDGASDSDQTAVTGEAQATNAAGSTWLLPECLRTPEKVRTESLSSCLPEAIAHYTKLLLLLVALGSFGYVLYGAFLYASAFGDQAKTEQGKKAISHALIGVVIATVAELAVQYMEQVLRKGSP